MKKLLYLLVFLLISSPVFVFGATYYLRADGSAAIGSTSGCGAAGDAANEAAHDGGTFSGDDIIYLCNDGGTFTELTPPSNGTEGHPIIYIKAQATKPVIGDTVKGFDLTSEGQHDITIDGISFNNMSDHWIDAHTTNRITIQNCTFYDAAAYQGIQLAGCTYTKVIDNVFSDAPTSGTETSPADMIYITGSASSYNLFEGNTFGKSSHQSIDITSTTIGHGVYRGNTFQNTYHTGLHIAGDGPNLVENNLFYDQGDIHTSNPNPASAGDERLFNPGIQLNGPNNIIRKNIFDNNGASIDQSQYDANTNTDDNRIYNNTMNKAVRVMHMYSDYGAYPISDNIYKNNAFTNSFDYPDDGATFGVGYELVGRDQGGTGNRWLNNATYGGDGDHRYNATYGSFAAIIAAFPTEFPSGNTATDPKYTNAAGRDFTLASDSTLIDAGTWLTEAVGAAGGGSSASLTVDDAAYFYDGWGISGETADYIYIVGDGDPANVLVQISSISGNVITLASAQNWEDNADIYLAYSSTVGFFGTAPDIGAEEYSLQVYNVSPVDGGGGYSITASATWDYVATVDDVDVWLDKGTCVAVGKTTLVSDDDADKTYDMSTLDELSTYCLVLVANDGALQGTDQEFQFTTTEGPPAPPAGLAVGVYSASGLTGVYDDQGATVGE